MTVKNPANGHAHHLPANRRPLLIARIQPALFMVVIQKVYAAPLLIAAMPA
jgi:hypothetical protein